MANAASASFQSYASRMMMTPMRVRPLITSEVAPSTTNWLMASMSEVSRLTLRPVGVRSWCPSSSRIMWRNSWRRRSSSTRSPTHDDRYDCQ